MCYAVCIALYVLRCAEEGCFVTCPQPSICGIQVKNVSKQTNTYYWWNKWRCRYMSLGWLASNEDYLHDKLKEGWAEGRWWSARMGCGNTLNVSHTESTAVLIAQDFIAKMQLLPVARSRHFPPCKMCCHVPQCYVASVSWTLLYLVPVGGSPEFWQNKVDPWTHPWTKVFGICELQRQTRNF